MTIAEALGWTLIHSLWQGAIVAAMLATLLLIVPSPRFRYVASCASLIAILFAFAITLLHYLPTSGTIALTSGGQPLAPWRTLSDVTFRRPFPEMVPWLAPLWLIGVSFSYVRCATGWIAINRLRRRGVSLAPPAWEASLARLVSELKLARAVILLESILTETPVVLGHFHPVILVPIGFLTGLSADHVEAILLHELAHIRRSDYLVNLCQRLIEGLLFYHPAVWWISHVIRSERENCCDDMVVSLRGDAHSYAVALTALEQNRLSQQWPARTTALAATGGSLMKRIERLLYPKHASGTWAPVLAAMALMFTTATLLSAWHMNTAQAQTSAQNQWQKWLNEDVVYIISEPEKAAFERLTTDDERRHFIEQFWERRNPTPGSAENVFKTEHYRRIAYANKHWSTNGDGWRTDFGRLYIKYGPPDEIDSHPKGGNYIRPDSEGGGTAATYPFEDWRYAKFQGVGNLDIEFVDTTGSGEMRMTLDPSEKYRK